MDKTEILAKLYKSSNFMDNLKKAALRSFPRIKRRKRIALSHNADGDTQNETARKARRTMHGIAAVGYKEIKGSTKTT